MEVAIGEIEAESGDLCLNDLNEIEMDGMTAVSAVSACVRVAEQLVEDHNVTVVHDVGGLEGEELRDVRGERMPQRPQ